MVKVASFWITNRVVPLGKATNPSISFTAAAIFSTVSTIELPTAKFAPAVKLEVVVMPNTSPETVFALKTQVEFGGS